MKFDPNIIRNFKYYGNTKSTASIATHFEDSESLMLAYIKRKIELNELKQKHAETESELNFSKYYK